MGERLRNALPWAYLAGLVWLNGYLVRHVFALTFTGAMHSMHGFWMALGRIVGDGWWRPGWVPDWAGGMPVELTYAPLVPWLGEHWGLYAVLAAVFCLGPAAFYLMTLQLTGKPGWAFAAGVVYSLLSPTELLLPDAGFQWVRLLEPRRMYLTLIWDEAPHQLALAFVCLAVVAWRREWRTAAALLVALAALANPFGVTGAALFGLCWALAGGAWRTVAFSGVFGYLLVCPFYPPSMLGILRANGALAPESAWGPWSWAGALGLLAGLAAVAWATRRWAREARFAALLAWLTVALTGLFAWGRVVVLPQPARYKSELELALVLGAVLLLERALRGRPRWVLAVVALLAVAGAGRQVVRHRKFARSGIRQAVTEETIEYRASQVLRGHVLAAGSLAQWANAFADVRQYGGGSYTTAPNVVQQRLVLELTGEQSAERFVRWMQAVGVDAVLIPGRQSPEFWKPYAKDPLADKLPVIWEERDTRLYEIPRARRTMAAAVPGMVPLEQYVAAIEAPDAPVLPVEWRGREHAFVRGAWRARDMILLHMNWHPDWKALLDGKPVPTGADGLGQLVVAPGGTGELELVWEPDWRTRWVSLLAAAVLAGLGAVRFRDT